MTFYYQHKWEAEDAAREIVKGDERIARWQVGLEPWNGWEIVLIPQIMDIKEYNEVARVRHPDGRCLTRPPEGVKLKPPRAPASTRKTKTYKPVVVPPCPWKDASPVKPAPVESRFEDVEKTTTVALKKPWE